MSSVEENRPVFDASAVLALMDSETGSKRLQKLLPDAVVSAVNVAEVLAKLVSRGMPPNEAQAAIDALHLETLPFEGAMARISAHYVRKGISLGNRCFLAAAYLRGPGWTSDRELRGLSGEMVPTLNFLR